MERSLLEYRITAVTYVSPPPPPPCGRPAAPELTSNQPSSRQTLIHLAKAKAMVSAIPAETHTLMRSSTPLGISAFSVCRTLIGTIFFPLPPHPSVCLAPEPTKRILWCDKRLRGFRFSAGFLAEIVEFGSKLPTTEGDREAAALDNFKELESAGSSDHHHRALRKIENKNRGSTYRARARVTAI